MHAWISVSANEIANSLQPLRLTHVVSKAEAAHHLGVDEALLDMPGMRRRTERVLRRMDQHLAAHDWLAGSDAPTVADIACYGYLALAEEAAIDLCAYPAIAAWRGRIQQLPSYVPPAHERRDDQHNDKPRGDNMDATQAAEPIARPHKKPNLFRVAVATVIGTAVEAFDFLAYGTAAALVFNKIFFPQFDPVTGTLGPSARSPAACWHGLLAASCSATSATASAANPC